MIHKIKNPWELKPFVGKLRNGVTPMPKSYTSKMDADYRAFLKGKRPEYQIKVDIRCEKTGGRFDRPCKLTG